MSDAPGAGAASVATQLLAFYREPARFRPHYIHGDEPLPEGDAVLKFALGRFAPGWHRDLPRHEQEELTQAARAFVRQVCLWERATHYQVLCLDRTAGADEVKENYRLLMALLHPDRQDADWPADSAQRVNDAYAVLSEEGARRAYDEGIRRSHPPAAPMGAPGVALHPQRRRRSFVRPFVAVVGGAAALFLVQAWWMNDVPRHYTLLERALPVGSAQWVRDVLPNDLPRFLDVKPAIAFDPIEVLGPSKAVPRLASVSVWTPPGNAGPISVVETRPAPTIASPLVPLQREAPVPAARDAASPVAMTARESAPPTRLAQVASPATVAAPAHSTPSTEEIETLVARLVSYYEAGDSEGLVALFDPAEMGFWKGMRTRSAYADFFRSTKQRRLRMDRLDWQTAPQAAQARGQATLVADAAEGTTRIERKVDVEIDIGMRNGQARITRLSLFPDVK
jgi:hypothetical protein